MITRKIKVILKIESICDILFRGLFCVFSKTDILKKTTNERDIDFQLYPNTECNRRKLHTNDIHALMHYGLLGFISSGCCLKM